MQRIKAKGWDMDLALDLLKSIETAFLTKDVSDE